MEGADKEQLRSKCIKLLRAVGCEEAVIEHCIAVAELALEIADTKEGVDKELVFTGAMLHDIGRARTHGIEHGFLGGEIARALGLDDKLVRIIQRHVGAGLTAKEAELLGLPIAEDFLPETMEEKIVTYADCLIEGTRRTSIEHTISKFKEKLGENHPAIERLKKLHRALTGEPI